MYFHIKVPSKLGIYRLNNQEVIKHFLISLSLLQLLLTNKPQRKHERPKEDILLLLNTTSELHFHWTKQNPQLWPPPNKGGVMLQIIKQLKSYQGEGSYPEPSQLTRMGHTLPCWRAWSGRSSMPVGHKPGTWSTVPRNVINIFSQDSAFFQGDTLPTSSCCKVCWPSL